MTGPDLGLADALATALAVTGETGPLPAGYEALIIGSGGRRRSTPGFPLDQVSPVPANAAGGGQRLL